MRLWSDSFIEGGVIPPECAFALIDPATHTRFAANRNPHLAWDDVPSGTQSLALFCRDVDAPSVGTNVNKEGKVVAEDLPRVEFYHWTLVDIPVALKSIGEGHALGYGDAARQTGPAAAVHHQERYRAPVAPGGQRLHQLVRRRSGHGWRLLRLRRPVPALERPAAACLHFLSVRARLARDSRWRGASRGAEARLAIRGHILDEAQVFGVYSLNPEVAEALGR